MWHCVCLLFVGKQNKPILFSDVDTQVSKVVTSHFSGRIQLFFTNVLKIWTDTWVNMSEIEISCMAHSWHPRSKGGNLPIMSWHVTPDTFVNMSEIEISCTGHSWHPRSWPPRRPRTYWYVLGTHQFVPGTYIRYEYGGEKSVANVPCRNVPFKESRDEKWGKSDTHWYRGCESLGTLHMLLLHPGLSCRDVSCWPRTLWKSEGKDAILICEFTDRYHSNH